MVQGKDDIRSENSYWLNEDKLNMSSINCMPKNLNCNAIIVTMECTKKTLTKKCKSKQSCEHLKAEWFLFPLNENTVFTRV